MERGEIEIAKVLLFYILPIESVGSDGVIDHATLIRNNSF